MRRSIFGLVAVLLAGCGGVYSEQPASDDASTKVDERLIGFWRVDLAASGEPDNGTGTRFVFVVGKRKPPETGLELLAVGLDKDGVFGDVTREALRATTIGGKPYASLQVMQKSAGNTAEAEQAKDESGWVILRYDVSEPGVLRVLGMDETAVKKDVTEKRIAGTAPETKPGEAPAKDEVINLSATTYALRAWLESRGDALFKTGKPFVLRRLDVR